MTACHDYLRLRHTPQNIRNGRQGNSVVNTETLGEIVRCLKPGARGKDDSESRWREGVRLEIADRAGEVSFGTDEGVVKVMDVKPKEVGEARDLC